jgi:hypothetical protein
MISSIEVWALPLNTFLLIGLALVNAYIARTQRSERRDLIDVKRSMGLTRRKYDDPGGEKTPGNNDRPPDSGERRRATDHI